MFKGKGRDENSGRLTRLVDYRRDLHAVALARLQSGVGGGLEPLKLYRAGDDYFDKNFM